MSVIIVNYSKGKREKVLLTLQEHDEEVRRAYEKEKYSSKNGIECPNCKTELVDCGRGILLSYPPQKEIECLECGWKGYRYC